MAGRKFFGGWPTRATAGPLKPGVRVRIVKTKEAGKIVRAFRGRMPGTETYLVRLDVPNPDYGGSLFSAGEGELELEPREA